MTVTAKFVHTGVSNAYGDSRTLVFEAQYDDKIPEDVRFAKATPTGTITMRCDNPAANAQFVLGHAYYVDFTAVS